MTDLYNGDSGGVTLHDNQDRAPVRIPGCLEQLLGLLEVEWILLDDLGLVRRAGLAKWQDLGTGVAVEHLVDDALAIDGVLEPLADQLVVHRRHARVQPEGIDLRARRALVDVELVLEA